MPYDFNKIASTYDRLNHIMTLGLDRRWRRLAVRELPTSNFQLSILDVACGTGDMSIQLLKKGCQVTGVDLSEEMLAIARQKTDSAGFQLSSFDFQLADAEQLPFPDASFDAVTCAFGIRNFVNLDRGLSEMVRVLKPGGTVAILELATPDNSFVLPFYNLYTRRVIPLLGRLIARNRQAYTYLPDSVERFHKGDAMLSILSAHGLESRQRKFLFGVCRLYVSVKKNP